MSVREHDRTVIVAAAGLGSRFKTPGSKESYGPAGEALIQLAYGPVAPVVNRRVVVVLRPNKLDLLPMLVGCADEADMCVVFQTDEFGSLMSAVETAAPYCVGPTALLLADQVLESSTDRLVLAESFLLCERYREDVVICAPRHDLSHNDGGLLRVERREDGKLAVSANEENPVDSEPYSHAWFALVAESADKLLERLPTANRPRTIVGALARQIGGFHNVNTLEDAQALYGISVRRREGRGTNVGVEP